MRVEDMAGGWTDFCSGAFRADPLLRCSPGHVCCREPGGLSGQRPSQSWHPHAEPGYPFQNSPWDPQFPVSWCSWSGPWDSVKGPFFQLGWGAWA